MNPKAPARPGNLLCRPAPRRSSLLPTWLLSASLVASLAGCAAPLTPPSAVHEPGAGQPASAGPPAAEPTGAQAPATGTATTPAQEGAPAPGPRLLDDTGPIPEVALNSQLMFQLLASEIAAQRGELASATTTYLAMARQTRDPRLARRATELALTARAPAQALPAARLWHELSPASTLAAQTTEALLLQAGQLAEAEPLLAARLAEARSRNELAAAYTGLRQLLARSSNIDPAAALAMLERLAAPDAQVAHARLALAAQASAADDPARAAREAEAALSLAPDDESVAVAAAQYLATSDTSPDAAIARLEAFVARQPESLEARFTLARLLAATGRNDEARAQFEAVLARQPESPPILFSLAQLAWQTGQPEAAEHYLKRYLALPDTVLRNDNPAWLFLGQIAEAGGRIGEAIEHYARVQRGEQFMPALIRRALLMARQGRLDEARKLLGGTAVPTNRERVQLISAEAQVLRESGRPDEALALLGKSLERLPENPELLYDHAMAAERVGRLDLLEGSLRRLIALQPSHAHAYNALGYTFADRNIRLDEAEQLIQQALALKPGDAHILDSMGWVLYRRGNLPRALDFLRQAWAASPEAEIAVHLGEVLWVSGARDEARELLRKAREIEPDNETLRDTLARLGVSL